MKLKVFIILAVSLLSVSYKASACGPYYETVPYPDYLKFDIDASEQPSDYDRNIELWKKETSVSIPDSVIRVAIYKMHKTALSDKSNAFIKYAIDHNHRDIIEFLTLAKTVENLRADQTSPWYYPKDSLESKSLYQPLVEECRRNRDGHFHDRYGLQLIRCLFAQGEYEECIEEYKGWYASTSDANLFKQMSMDYVVGAYTRLGLTEEADKYTALRGLVYNPHTFELVAAQNPSEENLWRYVNQLDHRDEKMMRPLLPTIHRILDGNRSQVRNIGRWLLLGAYIENDFNGNTAQARKWLTESACTSMSAEMAAHIKAYSMLLDARSGKTDNLTANVQWLVGQIQSGKTRRISEADDQWSCAYHESYWEMVLKNLIWDFWVPNLLDKGDAPMAIRISMVADFAPFEIHGNIYRMGFFDHNKRTWVYENISLNELRKSKEYDNTVDYGCYTFNMMYAQTPEAVIAWQKSLGTSPLDMYGRHDSDYVNDLIGTMLLRDQRYAEAERYLAKVSPEYQYTLNTYKGGYLGNDFTQDCGYEMEWTNDWSYQYFTYRQAPTLPTAKDAKLRFDREMIALQKEMHNPDPNKSSLAKVKYAIRMMNSYESCWALTAYRKGAYAGTMYDNKYYSEVDHTAQFCQYNDLIADARHRFNDPEYAAQAEAMLHNYATIASRYPYTTQAKYLRAHCDNYEDWLGWETCR